MTFKKLTPNFSVENVGETVKFYQEHLDFKLDMAVPMDSTEIEEEISDQHEYAFAMMSRDEVFVMFIERESFGADIPALKSASKGTSVLFYLDVDNVDEIYKKLKGNVEIIKGMETTWYGMREFYIKDCNGYILGFAERA